MAASNEWEDMHLTPGGWVDGSFKADFAPVREKPVPADAVLTIRRRVKLAFALGSPDISEAETKHTQDDALIRRLLEQHGRPTFGV